MAQESFIARRIGLLKEGFNVLGTIPGTGGGFSLIFNNHMDTAVPSTPDFVHRDPANDIYHKAWIEGGLLVGEGICNDKGPMAAFLIAAKAIKDSGHRLKGDLLVSAVIAETSREPCDDPRGAMQESKELGARFLVTPPKFAECARRTACFSRSMLLAS